VWPTSLIALTVSLAACGQISNLPDQTESLDAQTEATDIPAAGPASGDAESDALAVEESGPSWACLDAPIVWPRPPPARTLTFSVTFVNFSAQAPYVGSTVKACDKMDLTCASPLDSAITDATGTVTVTVPAGLSGFDGYLDVTGGLAGANAAVFPALWYPVPFVVADGWRGTATLLEADEFELLAMAVSTTADASRGAIAVNAVDCAFRPAAGVSFVVDAADSSTTGYYLWGGVPVPTATATDGSGIASFLNVPTTASPMGDDATVAIPRQVVVRAVSLAAGGKSLGSLTLVVRPGAETTASSFPPIP
jgi:hypothetical protein